jgi:hypothetical protein
MATSSLLRIAEYEFLFRDGRACIPVRCLERTARIPHGFVAIGAIAEVDIQNVHGYISGEHGESQVPVWSASNLPDRASTSTLNRWAFRLTDADKKGDCQPKPSMAGHDVFV